MTSRRAPASLALTVKRTRESGTGATQHLHHQNERAGDDGHVGNVERRPAIHADEVDYRPVEAEAVDEIAQRPAKDQAKCRTIPRRREPGRASGPARGAPAGWRAGRR